MRKIRISRYQQGKDNDYNGYTYRKKSLGTTIFIWAISGPGNVPKRKMNGTAGWRNRTGKMINPAKGKKNGSQETRMRRTTHFFQKIRKVVKSDEKGYIMQILAGIALQPECGYN